MALRSPTRERKSVVQEPTSDWTLSPPFRRIEVLQIQRPADDRQRFLSFSVCTYLSRCLVGKEVRRMAVFCIRSLHSSIEHDEPQITGRTGHDILASEHQTARTDLACWSPSDREALDVDGIRCRTTPEKGGTAVYACRVSDNRGADHTCLGFSALAP